MRFLATAVLAVPLALAPCVANAQSLLDRPDNVSTDWVGSNGVLYFNFVHRFTTSPPPERKVTNFPTFLIATGIASKALIGVNYATNSPLAARYPNEWEFFGRYAPLQQEDGAPFDLGGQLDYNLSVKGVDGEVSLARREGPLRVIGVVRSIADTLDGNKRRFSFGGGGTLRFGRFIAVTGDATTLTDRRVDEKIAWSAGLHIALPNTPHTLSLHVSNASTSTLQGFARGGDRRRYGFEFTIPIHVNRFFTTPEPVSAAAEGPPGVDVPSIPTVTDTATPPRPAVTNPAAPVVTAPTPTPTPTRADTARTTAAPARTNPTSAAARPAAPQPQRAAPKTVTARMKGQAYIPSSITIDAGTTVTWKNLDALIHTVTAVDKSFNSGVIAADGSYSHTFTKPGTYPIFCVAHPFMKATVVVK
ncbi:MAG: blue (type 1) copper domain protein [Gemmatimonadetes bacterium]|nr:blue (type 1) copper domain protein [Gemmatimonadota bacterium]